MTEPVSKDDVLLAFAVEPVHDTATLDRYILAHPRLRDELMALATELRKVEFDDSPLDLDSPIVRASWARYSGSDQ